MVSVCGPLLTVKRAVGPERGDGSATGIEFNIGEIDRIADAETGHADGRGGCLVKFERAHALERDGNGRARVDGIGKIDKPAALDIDGYRAVDT